jgi:hypothetical protein
MTIDGDVGPVLASKPGVVSRWILGDVLAALDCVMNKQKMFNIFQFTGKGVYYDDFYLDDPLPFFAQGGYYAAKFLKGFKFNPTEDSVLDIDRI